MIRCSMRRSTVPSSESARLLLWTGWSATAVGGEATRGRPHWSDGRRGVATAQPGRVDRGRLGARREGGSDARGRSGSLRSASSSLSVRPASWTISSWPTTTAGSRRNGPAERFLLPRVGRGEVVQLRLREDLPHDQALVVVGAAPQVQVLKGSTSRSAGTDSQCLGSRPGPWAGVLRLGRAGAAPLQLGAQQRGRSAQVALSGPGHRRRGLTPLPERPSSS